MGKLETSYRTGLPGEEFRPRSLFLRVDFAHGGKTAFSQANASSVRIPAIHFC